MIFESQEFFCIILFVCITKLTILLFYMQSLRENIFSNKTRQLSPSQHIRAFIPKMLQHSELSNQKWHNILKLSYQKCIVLASLLNCSHSVNLFRVSSERKNITREEIHNSHKSIINTLGRNLHIRKREESITFEYKCSLSPQIKIIFIPSPPKKKILQSFLGGNEIRTPRPQATLK